MRPSQGGFEFLEASFLFGSGREVSARLLGEGGFAMRLILVEPASEDGLAQIQLSASLGDSFLSRGNSTNGSEFELAGERSFGSHGLMDSCRFLSKILRWVRNAEAISVQF
jgi:hypothetical protein